jgi:hypothetical protein
MRIRIIFLISQPRAGSTMLQKILGSHPDVFTTSEPWIALTPLYGLREEGVRAEFGHGLARRALREFLHGLPEGEAAYWDAVRLMLEHLYGRALAESGKRIFLDKTPRYHLVIPELQQVFPEAGFILLLRNPLAVLASILEPGDVGPDGLRQLRPDLVTAPVRLAQAMAAPAGRRQCTVRYEEFVQQAEAETVRLCHDLHLAPHAEIVNYGSSQAGREHWMFGDQETVYRETRPVSTRAGRWAEVLRRDPDWARLAHGYLHELGPQLLKSLGYDASELADALGPASQDDGKLWRQVMGE